MGKKISLENEKIIEIRNLYLKEKKTTKEISRLINISDTVICKTLKEINSYINTNYIDKINFKKGDLQKEINKRKDLLLLKDFAIHEIKEENKTNFIAICKITGKIFKDYKNSSGALTNHLNEIFPGFIHPSNFIKREYKLKYGKYWHEQYFDLISIEESKKEKLKCSYCDWNTNDLSNKSGCYTSHLKNEHQIYDIKNHLEKNPSESFLFKTLIEKSIKKEIILSNNKKSVECIICKEKFAKITEQHLRSKHGISLLEYKTNFSTNTMSEDYRDKMIKSYNENLKNFGHTFTLKSQTEIKDFLLENKIIVELNNRKILNGIEIDIFSEDKKIGIEFNGNMFHSELFGKKDSKYHLNKTFLMNSKDYHLIHIFEDEWELKKDIVKNKLIHILGNNNLEKIYARKCVIKKINKEEKDVFLNKNHIQGTDNSSVFLGAFFNNNLISVMTFDNKRSMSKRKNDDNSYELSRFATDINYRIIGIASKMLNYFIKKYNPKNIISFADRRWTLDKNNNLYTKLGFELKNILRPDYSYYNTKIDIYKRFHKFGFGKKSIKKKFPEIYSPEKTEWQMMQEAGYDRIWDCGKFCYELNLK